MNLTLYAVYLLDADNKDDMNLRTLIGTTIHGQQIPGMLKMFEEDLGGPEITESDYMVEDFELPMGELKEFFTQK